jgi:hypothetical protein
MRALTYGLGRNAAIVLVALGTVACTALLGDFSVGGTDSTSGGPGEGGTEGGGPVDSAVPIIMPSEAKVGVLRSQKLTASNDVTWSVEEPTGGTIDATGKYISPEEPGVFHVVATNKADPTKSAKATVTVVPLGLSILVGKPGGAGNVDGAPDRVRFRGPAGVAFLGGNSGSAELTIIADTGNHTIRKFDRGTNKVTTLAGTPGKTGTANGVGQNASFNAPTIVVANEQATDAAWVLDSNNNCIRRIDVVTGAVTTLAGLCGTSAHNDSTDGTGATARFEHIDAMVLGAARDALYVCEIGNFRAIRRIGLVTGKTTTPITGINNGCSMATDFYRGFVYFNDNNNELAIKRFLDPPGGPPTNPPLTTVVSPLPGNYFRAMAADTGYGNQDEIYAISNQQPVIHRYRFPPTGAGTGGAFDMAAYAGAPNEQLLVDGTPDKARFQRPSAITAVSSRSFLYVTDEGSNVVRRIDPYQNKVSTAFGAPANTAPVDGPRVNARLTGPVAFATDAAGNLMFSDVSFDQGTNNTIRRFDPTAATVATLSGFPTRAGIADPPVDGPHDLAKYGVPWDMVRVGNDLFVVDLFGHAIRQVSLATGDVKTLAGELTVKGNSDGVGAAAHFTFFDPTVADAPFPAGITTDGTDLYVADGGNHAIRKVTIATGAVTTIAGGTAGTANGVGKAAQFLAPGGITYVDGSLYIADGADNVIRRLDVKTSEVFSFIGLSGQAGIVDGDASVATLAHPFRIAADDIGNIYVGETPGKQGSGVIRRIAIKQRIISTFAGVRGQLGMSPGPLPAGLNCPTAFYVNAKGDLVVGDVCDGAVGIIQPL